MEVQLRCGYRSDPDTLLRGLLKKGFTELGVESYAAILEPYARTANAVDSKFSPAKIFLAITTIRPNTVG